MGLARTRSFGPSVLLALALALPARAATALPPQVDAARFQSLLQSFVDRAYLKAFRHLGDERDFDHGHFLFASADPGAAPVAILYHTQELAYYADAAGAYGWLDREGRNWLQWLSDGRIENARRYRRAALPPSLAADAPALARHRTIVAAMLDPAAFGALALRSRQVVFTRGDCGAAGASLSIRLPGRGRVCLGLSEY